MYNKFAEFASLSLSLSLSLSPFKHYVFTVQREFYVQVVW